MGLTKNSVGRSLIQNRQVPSGMEGSRVIAFAGNPNVGKSTLFNGLTGMKQHTGNWPGKTVETATGICCAGDRAVFLVDLPGTYSLLAHSREEEVARDYILSGRADGVVVVCDATCLERNLNLVLQVGEMTNHVLLCINLMDEAARKGIAIDALKISHKLGIPVVTTDARKKDSLRLLSGALFMPFSEKTTVISYPEPMETAIREVSAAIPGNPVNARWQARRMLEGEQKPEEAVAALVSGWQDELETAFGDKNTDLAADAILRMAEEICRDAVIQEKTGYGDRDRKLDRFFTGKATGLLSMVLLLAVTFWITIVGANVLSDYLGFGFARLEEVLISLCGNCGMPTWLQGVLIDGVYRVVSWVVSVMLPPMAIFFPLFTLLEDAGVLPRIAYNLDRPFQSCNACGKQALCMCMGFGCNAAGVAGCRIIDSPRERLLAILTNSFVPCNGRFPAILLLITVFLTGTGRTLPAACILTGVILLGIFMTFAATRLLSNTVLKGVPSSFTLELPSYRMPRIGSVIVRSVMDRTLFVLGRAVISAAPAGLIIYVLGNCRAGGSSLLTVFSSFLDPLGHLLGMDGVILLAFLLGLPANEIVIPIMLMAYTSAGSPVSTGSTEIVGSILRSNGWTVETALCVMVFFLMHWPCATTLMTIRKETGSGKWTLLAALLPTAFGCLFCLLIHGLFSIL